MSTSSKHMADRLLATADLMEWSFALMRQNIRRSLPNASEELVDLELRRWAIEQPEVFHPGDKYSPPRKAT